MRHKTNYLLMGILTLTLVTSGCTTIQLVSNYDETIDGQAQQVQKKFDTYFISLQAAKGDDLKYKSQQKLYQELLADLNAMSIRASGIYKNKITIEQIDLAKENLAYLVLLHKQCITTPLTDSQKEKVRTNGIDLSLDCRVDNGATENVPDRGDIAINRFVVAPIQSLFNQHIGAVMALELAKKRGENQSK
ncbi:MAG: hypothetical protein Q7V20_21825 [Aquabacterium sp.]|uniref:hypothetical protein n=1 Tax=Aquabacterium sp. TaxID=1872578 RepID=UPI00271EEA98|nr:hypothetical protein [Aquabacterium sp.]MDO9006092.1 hypothetical protein [Aquabacterium sp.]